MKVGVLSQWFAPEPGGGTVPTVLANGLQALGHDVRVLTGFPNYPTGRVYPGYRQSARHEESLRDGLRVRRVPLFASHDDGAVKRSLNYVSFSASAMVLGRRALADRDAVWVFNSPATVPVIAESVRRRSGVPFLLHLMDVWPDSVKASGMIGGSTASRIADRALTALVRRGYDGASIIAVTSPGQLDLLSSRGVPTERMQYCPVWANEAIFFPRQTDRSVLPEQVRSATKILMYAGALGHVQGLDRAIRAAAAVRDTGLHLVLVGSGIAETDLRALANDLAADNVHFLGRRPPEDMGVLGSAADVHLVSLVDTPLMRMTMPSKLPSVMALAKPVVMCGSGDAADVVGESGAGVVAPGADVEALAGLLRDIAGAGTDELARWGESGLSYYRKTFSEARGISHVEAMLQDITK